MSYANGQRLTGERSIVRVIMERDLIVEMTSGGKGKGAYWWPMTETNIETMGAAGRLIRAEVSRQKVAIIYDAELSTHGLYWILLSAGRKGVKKRDYRANSKHGRRLWHPVNL